jgi:hypothetical protein
MSDEIKQEVGNDDGRLPDDAYMAWVVAEIECEQALRAWFAAPPARHAESYSVYRAALDREEAAAADLKRVFEPADPCRYVAAQREQAGLR